MGRFIVFCFFIGITHIMFGQNPYQDLILSPEDRANDLVSRLTLEEKVKLMMNASDAIPRLGIKQYEWWNEALHGVARNGVATVFPQAIGMAASFDNELLFRVFTAVSDEARVKHRQAKEKGPIKRYQGLTMWTPNINIFRDPRWGRGQETYGEDPYLTSVMGVAVIKGLQGESRGQYHKLHACAKHYAVHSGPEWNRHSFNANNISSRDLWETYLPAFKNAVIKGNVQEVMCAYNRFEGEPCCGSSRLLTKILREQWNYKGIVVTDCGAIDNFYKPDRHLTHPDSAHASASAIINGTDLECGSSFKSLHSALKNGLISEETINTSLKRLFTARFQLGEMDSITPWDYLPDSLVNCTLHKNLALQMAQKSIVLLQNKNILPLSRKQKIALLGPNANDSVMQWGNYNGIPKQTSTLFTALNHELKDQKLIYDAACELTDKKESIIKECSFNGKPGFSVTYWNNPDMKDNPALKTQISTPIRIVRREKPAEGINTINISGNFQSTFTPKVTGKVEFIFTTSSYFKLYINHNPVALEQITKNLQVYHLDATAGKSYEINIEYKRGSEPVEFRFNIMRIVPIDIKQILNTVKTAEIVIFAGGISANLEREDANVYAPGFKGGDRTSIELPQVQRNLIDALKKAGKKVILVNFSGSAMGLVPETENCDAILQAWYPGEAGGRAIADILYGRYNPSGRLPVTFYKSTDQLPVFENYSMQGRTYRFMSERPLFPFGYGLSYTTFQYGTITTNTNNIKTGDTLKVFVPVINTGKLDGEEVVQVYLKKKDDIKGPNKALRAFKRLKIHAGKTEIITFHLTSENLEWWNEITGETGITPGDYLLQIGGSSKDEDLTSFEFKIL